METDFYPESYGGSVVLSMQKKSLARKIKRAAEEESSICSEPGSRRFLAVSSWIFSSAHNSINKKVALHCRPKLTLDLISYS